jgi:hypothetical protein
VGGTASPSFVRGAIPQFVHDSHVYRALSTLKLNFASVLRTAFTHRTCCCRGACRAGHCCHTTHTHHLPTPRPVHHRPGVQCAPSKRNRRPRRRRVLLGRRRRVDRTVVATRDNEGQRGEALADWKSRVLLEHIAELRRTVIKPVLNTLHNASQERRKNGRLQVTTIAEALAAAVGVAQSVPISVPPSDAAAAAAAAATASGADAKLGDGDDAALTGRDGSRSRRRPPPLSRTRERVIRANHQNFVVSHPERHVAGQAVALRRA